MKDWAGNPLKILQEFGQSLWLDGIERSLLRSGELARHIEEDGVSGIKSNPERFQRALVQQRLYQSDILNLHASGADAREIYAQLAIQDVREAADALSRVYERSGRIDGLVSLDLPPRLTDDEAMIAEARRLWIALARPNAMIRIPSTAAGLAAVQQLVADGINVSATSLFNVGRYREALEAYASGLEARVSLGRPLAGLASVAEIAVGEIDAVVDAKLLAIRDPGEMLAAQALLGKAGRDVARYAYQEFKKFIASPRWHVLASYGACAQRLLWASTENRNPAYSDVKYVDELIGRQTVSAVSIATLDRYRGHGRPALTLEENVYETAVLPADLERLGVEMDRVSIELEARELRSSIAVREASVAVISAQCSDASLASAAEHVRRVADPSVTFGK